MSAADWSALDPPLTPWILDVVRSGMGHTAMTPVQAATIPLFMKNKDVVVEAVTGSGKTLAFVIPVLERLVRRGRRLRPNELGALIVSPTRELAAQIHAVVALFLSSQPESDAPYPPPLLLVSSKSSPPAADYERFRATGADIAVGTPGRVEELLLGRARGGVSTKELEVLVLDEADRLLDPGFTTSLTRIIGALPKLRRTGLFSATMADADALAGLVRAGLRNPARVVVRVAHKRAAPADADATAAPVERRIPATLKIYAITCPTSHKLLQLARLLSHETTTHASSRLILYLSTAAEVDYLYRILPSAFAAVPSSPPVTLFSLHGHLPPPARTRVLASFAAHPATPSAPALLLATDVAARGLDLPALDAVVQLDAPPDARAFAHRAGRTARAGRAGRAYVLLAPRQTAYVPFLAVRGVPVRARGALDAEGAFGDAPADEEGEGGEAGGEEAGEEDADVKGMCEAVRAHVRSDRALADRGARALVSFARAHAPAAAGPLLRARGADLVGRARAYGLLRLPRMPELSPADAESAGWRDADVDWASYAYADAAREEKRVREEAERREKPREGRRKKEEVPAWSRQGERKAEKAKKREKKVARRLWIAKAGKVDAAPAATGEKRRREEDDGGGEDGAGEEEVQEDWHEMAREDRRAKKARRAGGAPTGLAAGADFADL